MSNLSKSLYYLNIYELTSGSYSIEGAKSYSINVISGHASVNGVSIPAPYSLDGGNYEGACWLGAPINIGCTGGKVLIAYEN